MANSVNNKQTFQALYLTKKAWQQSVFDRPLYLTPIDTCHKMKPDGDMDVRVNEAQTVSRRHQPHTPACHPEPTSPSKSANRMAR